METVFIGKGNKLMQYEIIGESVKDAVIRELVRLFPNPPYFVYSETISPVNLRFPHFFVFQLSVNAEEERKDYWWIDYLINIRYRHVDNPQIFGTNIEKALDDVSFELMSGLDTINWFGTRHKVKMSRANEKIDGVLQCFYNVRIHAQRPKEEVALQMSLQLKQWIEEKGGI